MNTQLSIDFASHVRVARKLGTEAGARAMHKAESLYPEFSARALEFIAAHARQSKAEDRFTGEQLTNMMKLSGIRPGDDRAFGPVFAKAIKQGLIAAVGFAPRVKGHGTAGGRVYAKGEGVSS